MPRFRRVPTRYKWGLRVDARIDGFYESEKMGVAGIDFNLYA